MIFRTVLELQIHEDNSDGYKFLGEVPYSLEEALRETELDVYRLEIAGDAWFFSDKDGNYQYNM